jgi:ribonuclease BN (tRNA processing enzyme)
VIIRFLGIHNVESKDSKLVTFLIDEILAIDAGSVASELTFTEQLKIRAILLSHGHYDHIREVPAFAFSNASRLTRIFGSQETMQILSAHLLDGVIYPNFTDHNSFLGRAALELCPLQLSEPKNIEGYRVQALPVNHLIPAVGFEITSSEGKKIFFTGDTSPGLSNIWKQISPELLITDVAFPNRMEKVANDAGHLCPQMLKRELIEFHHIRGYLPTVVPIHLNPHFESEVIEELRVIAQELGFPIKMVSEGDQLIV